MKLSSILQQKAMIDSWEADKELSALNEKISMIKDDINNVEVTDLSDRLTTVNDSINDLVHDMNALQSNINHLKLQADELMQDMSKEPLQESYARYEERKNWFNLEQAEANRLYYDQFYGDREIKERFNTLITKSVSWRHPTLYIRPNSTHFLNALKASDILYVMEQCDVTEWFESVSGPTYFEKSVRFRIIDENKNTFITQYYPPEQMGFILMENFLTFKPLEIIKQYLNESMELLKPGGHLLFTYNNCDLASGARNFENGLYCYTPGKMLRLICEEIGFEVEDDTTTNRVSWFYLKKPGTLTSLKGGKCLGQIMKDD